MISNELYFVANHISREILPINTQLSQNATALFQKSATFRALITVEGMTTINETFVSLTLGLNNLRVAISGGNMIDIQQKAFSVFSLCGDVFNSFSTIEAALPVCQIRIGAEEYSELMGTAGKIYLDLEQNLTNLMFQTK